MPGQFLLLSLLVLSSGPRKVPAIVGTWVSTLPDLTKKMRRPVYTVMIFRSDGSWRFEGHASDRDNLIAHNGGTFKVHGNTVTIHPSRPRYKCEPKCVCSLVHYQVAWPQRVHGNSLTTQSEAYELAPCN